MHINGYMVISMRLVVWRGKIIECDPITGDMPHGNDHISLNMHAKALVYISKGCHCNCESIDMQTMFLACILRES